MEVKKSEFRDPSVIDYEIGAINGEIQKLNESLVALGNIRVSLEFKMKEFENLRAEGNKAWTESQNIGIGKICSHCGQEIKNSKALEAHKAELDRKVEEVRAKIGPLQQEINELTQKVNSSADEYNKINAAISQFTAEVSKRMTEKSTIASTLSEITRYQGLLDTATRDLSALGVVERVDLPDNFMEKMAEIQSGISA